MASFFEDPSPLIRVFIRHSDNPCAGGTAFYRTFIWFWTLATLEQQNDAGFSGVSCSRNGAQLAKT
jgi:hypothetical protein